MSKFLVCFVIQDLQKHQYQETHYNGLWWQINAIFETVFIFLNFGSQNQHLISFLTELFLVLWNTYKMASRSTPLKRKVDSKSEMPSKKWKMVEFGTEGRHHFAFHEWKKLS